MPTTGFSAAISIFLPMPVLLPFWPVNEPAYGGASGYLARCQPGIGKDTVRRSSAVTAGISLRRTFYRRVGSTNLASDHLVPSGKAVLRFLMAPQVAREFCHLKAVFFSWPVDWCAKTDPSLALGQACPRDAAATALAIKPPTGMIAPSPAPLTPSGLLVDGWFSRAIARIRKSVAVGIR